ncbi:hypothetical protein AB07_1673 [Citrobacter freundii]|nr:hypothetical protein AB07_1673 [Citrobacter freundii]
MVQSGRTGFTSAKVDSLVVLGGVIEEFMDLSPKEESPDFIE